MQIQFRGFQSNPMNVGCNWNRNIMQKKRQLMMEESSQKELESLKTSISSEAQELRQYKQSVESSQTNEKEKYADKLLKVEDTINKISNSLCRVQTEETLQEKLDALAELKKLQESQAFHAKKEEQALTEKSAKQQEEINENNSELLMVLECIEKIEEEEETEGDKKDIDGNSEEKKKQNDINMSDEVARIGASAAKKDMHMRDTIDAISQSGDEKLAKANEMIYKIKLELDNVYRVIENEQCSDEEKNEIISDFTYKVMGSYNDLIELRAIGLQQKQNARDIKREYIGSQHLIEARKAKEEMQAANSTGVIQQKLQEVVDRYGEKLEDRVQAKIDEKNDISDKEVLKREEEKTMLEELYLLQEEKEKQEILEFVKRLTL